MRVSVGAYVCVCVCVCVCLTEDLYVLSESRRVVVAQRLCVSERLQDRVGHEDALLGTHSGCGAGDLTGRQEEQEDTSETLNPILPDTLSPFFSPFSILLRCTAGTAWCTPSCLSIDATSSGTIT
jgi:hypothetical protein